MIKGTLRARLAPSAGLQPRSRMDAALTSIEPALVFPVPSIYKKTFSTYSLSSFWYPSMPEMNWGKEKQLSKRVPKSHIVPLNPISRSQTH